MADDLIVRKQGKDIWSRVTPDEVATAIASLGDRIEQLKDETWRFNVYTILTTSLWYQIINRLQLDNSEQTRHALYDVWHRKSHNIDKLVEKKIGAMHSVEKDIKDDDVSEVESILVSDNNCLLLPYESSVPLPQQSNTRAYQKCINDNGEPGSSNQTLSFVLSVYEWKEIFSRTHKKMKDGWDDILYKKLTSSGIKCPLKFKSPYIKHGSRKRSCRFFYCYARCTIQLCTREYQVILQTQPDENISILFLVKVLGEENHNLEVEIGTRQLSGHNRFLVGKRANEIGPLGVFREQIENADEELLAVGNYTQCQTIEVLKKAAADYREKMRIDEDMFKECRIIAKAYMKDDDPSAHIQGYIHDIGEIPFRTHLFAQAQVQRYIDYCRCEKYSFVHIDATGGILKMMKEQNQCLLYAMMFKEGDDAYDTVPLAHAILTKHTVASISYFLGNVAESITEVGRKLIRPSFFIIDFSAALLNAVLQAFNCENINNHLNRCWNVINKKYNAQELRSLSFIHFCCCHVIHAIARSLTASRIEKKTRRAVLHIFAIILCNNNIDELYDILGMIISIFGDPNEEKAREKMEQLLSFKLEVDEKSENILNNSKKIFKKAKKKNEELEEVDEYLRSNIPIIHQSPFNKEAVRRFPNLKDLINNKLKPDKINNPLFSPSLVRIFYRWWAYLPLWTGLLWNFEERYSNNIKKNITMTYFPIRYSNAVIESYFRTLKKCFFKGKKRNRPSDVIMELHRSVKAQSKADQFHIKQSAKGRKRKKQNVNVEEKWGKRTGEKKRRNAYFKTIDKYAAKRVRTEAEVNQSNQATISSAPDDTTSTSTEELSDSLSEESDVDNSSTESSASIDCKSTSSSQSDSKVSNKSSIDMSNNLGQPTADSGNKRKPSTEFEFEENEAVTHTETLRDKKLERQDDQLLEISQIEYSFKAETIIDGESISWPRFGVNKYVFEGQSYTLTMTCPIDTALFVLYFLYKTDIHFADEMEDPPSASVYPLLLRTFKIVEREGWDAARIFWLLKWNILKQSDKQPKSLFGSVDELVFSFIKSQQRHSTIITCTRSDCTQKKRHHSTSELTICSCDDHISKFEEASVGTCQAMIKRPNEVTVAEAREKKYKEGRVPMMNHQTNKNEYIQGWLCNSVNIEQISTFDFGYPPLIIVNIEPISRRSEEGYPTIPVRLRDMKRVVQLGSVRYKLRALIHNKNAHFTATLIKPNDKLYIYDDRSGMREVRTSGDGIEMGIYTRIHTFD